MPFGPAHIVSAAVIVLVFVVLAVAWSFSSSSPPRSAPSAAIAEASPEASPPIGGDDMSAKDEVRKATASLPQRVDIDPVIQGVWRMHAMSKDGGVTKEAVNVEGVVFCRARATAILLSDGTELKVDKVVIWNDRDGNPANAITFTNNSNVWAVSSTDNPRIFMLEVHSSDLKTEHLRGAITIER
jgi:hypothetical protein